MYFRHKQNPNADFLDNHDSSSGSDSENNQTIDQELANRKKPTPPTKGRPTNIPLITSNKALVKASEKEKPTPAEDPVFRNNFFQDKGQQSHHDHSEISEIERIGSVFNKSDEQIREVSSQAERSPSFKPVTKIPNFNVISKVPTKNQQDSIMSSESDPMGKDSEDLKIPLGSKKVVTPGRESDRKSKPPSDRNFFTETPGFKRDVKIKTHESESKSGTHNTMTNQQEDHTSAHTWKKEEPKSQSLHSEISKRQLKKAQFMPPDSKTGQIVPAYRQYVLDESINQQQVYMPHLSDREILEAFNALDINKDGHITSDEIAYFLEALEEEATEAEIEEMIKMLDLEGTGRVRYEEFYKLATGKNLNPISQAYPPSLDILEKKKTSDAKRRNEDGVETSGRGYDIKTGSYRNTPGPLDMSSFPREKSKFDQKQRGQQRMDDFEDEESRPPRTDREERDSSFKGFMRQAGLNLKTYMERYDKIEFSNEPWLAKATYQDFLNFFAMNSNDAARRVFALISKDRNYVDMKQMMIALSLYLDNSPDEKILLAYKLYDPDGREGCILYNELLKIFKVFLIGEDQKKIERKIKTILSGKALNPDDLISKEEFIKVSKNFPDLFN